MSSDNKELLGSKGLIEKYEMSIWGDYINYMSKEDWELYLKIEGTPESEMPYKNDILARLESIPKLNYASHCSLKY